MSGQGRAPHVSAHQARGRAHSHAEPPQPPPLPEEPVPDRYDRGRSGSTPSSARAPPGHIRPFSSEAGTGRRSSSVSDPRDMIKRYESDPAGALRREGEDGLDPNGDEVESKRGIVARSVGGVKSLGTHLHRGIQHRKQQLGTVVGELTGRLQRSKGTKAEDGTIADASEGDESRHGDGGYDNGHGQRSEASLSEAAADFDALLAGARNTSRPLRHRRSSGRASLPVRSRGRAFDASDAALSAFASGGHSAERDGAEVDGDRSPALASAATQFLVPDGGSRSHGAAMAPLPEDSAGGMQSSSSAAPPLRRRGSRDRLDRLGIHRTSVVATGSPGGSGLRSQVAGRLRAPSAAERGQLSLSGAGTAVMAARAFASGSPAHSSGGDAVPKPPRGPDPRDDKAEATPPQRTSAGIPNSAPPRRLSYAVGATPPAVGTGGEELLAMEKRMATQQKIITRLQARVLQAENSIGGVTERMERAAALAEETWTRDSQQLLDDDRAAAKRDFDQWWQEFSEGPLRDRISKVVQRDIETALKSTSRSVDAIEKELKRMSEEGNSVLSQIVSQPCALLPEVTMLTLVSQTLPGLDGG